MRPAPDSFGSKKRTVLLLRWTIVLGGSFLALYGSSSATTDPRVLAFVAVFLGTHLLASAVPEPVYENPRVLMGLVLFDAVWINLGMYLAGDASGDLFLLYFSVLFIAALGESEAMIAGGCVLVAVLHGTYLLRSADPFQSPAVLLRFPFLLGIGAFYGHLVVRTKRERIAMQLAARETRLRSDLAATLTHDLQTPISVIAGIADVLVQDGETLDATARGEFLVSIRKAAIETSELVSRFLASVSGGPAPRLSGTDVDVDRIAEEAVDHHRRAAGERRIRLDVRLAGTLPRIRGDPGELRRAVSNLVGNAVKFVGEGGSIAVVTERIGDAVVVRVADDGPGIPEAVRARLFEAYARDGASSGTGLGLFAVRSITEAHGGTVTVDSSPGRGSRFELRLPVSHDGSRR